MSHNWFSWCGWSASFARKNKHLTSPFYLMTVAKLISGIIAIFRLRRMLMSVTVASHMRYDNVTLWLDCPFEFHFARKKTFFFSLMWAGKKHVFLYIYRHCLIYFGYSFRFFVSAVHQNNEWMSEFWLLHRRGLVKCGTYSHLFYATHKDTHINNHNVFSLSHFW